MPPLLDESMPSPEEAVFPKGFRKLKNFVYPYINSANEIKYGKYPYPNGYDVSQPPSQAGGGEGGNPSLWDVHAQVEVTVTNTGYRTGKEVVQLYVSFPDNVPVNDPTMTNMTGPFVEFPVRVLRAFDKVEIRPGESTKVSFSLTRKDLSYWSVKYQNWIMPSKGKFTIRVGNSSRNLPLSATL